LSGDIQHYFVEYLVDRLPPETAHFLVCVSFVDTLHPALCQAITGRVDSSDILAELCDLTPIFTQGVGSEWLRIHSLAREFLRERFAALPADEQCCLRERAVSWLADQQMYEEAGRHALRAGLTEVAYELAERCLYDVILTGDLSRATEWREYIPLAEIERRPRLRLAVGWLLAHSERHVEAANLVGPIVDDPAFDEEIRCESAEICAAAAVFSDDLDESNRIIAPWIDTLSARSPIPRRVGIQLLANLRVFQGAPESARHYIQQFQSDADAAGRYVRGCGDWIIGLSYLWEGQVVLAEDYLRPVHATAEETSGRRNPMAVMLGAALAAILWERNALSEIQSLLANRLDVLERHTVPDSIIMGFVTAARIAAEERQERRAYDMLNTLFAVGEARSLPRLCIASLSEQRRMHALRSHKEICAGLASRLSRLTRSLDADHGKLLRPFAQLQGGIGHVYAAVVKHDWDDVLRQLDVLLPIAEGLRRDRERIQIQLLRALALKRCGNDGDTVLGEALSMAETLGLERLVEDTHPDIVDWARRIKGKHSADAGMLPGSREANPISIAPPAPRVDATFARIAPSALLTPKEREILGLVARNLSNKQIALALGTGHQTIKWHMSNICGKLSAINRKHALDRARMLGILELAA
jgi:LuxR family maltose regulon positive regulatory protein